jgi:hypothetical protein
MLHACFYTICWVFCYTSWYFYAFSGTNLLTRCHSASSLFSAVFVFQKSYIGNILGIGWNQSQTSRYFTELPEHQRGDRAGPRGWPHHQVARPTPGLHRPVVWAPRSTSDDAPLPIKTPQREKPKYPITFLEHIAICRRRRPEDREGLEALSGTLSERGIATGGLLHCHACLRSDEWVVYLGLWDHSSS